MNNISSRSSFARLESPRDCPYVRLDSLRGCPYARKRHSLAPLVLACVTAVAAFFANYGPFLAPVTPQMACGNGVFQVSVTYPITTLDLGLMGGFLPVPTTNPSATISVSDGSL